MARDYKGFGNQVASGVFESKETMTVDLSINNPKPISVANCLTAHLAKDGGAIFNRCQEGNGVLEWKSE